MNKGKRWFLLDTITAVGCTAVIFAVGFAAGYGVASWMLAIMGLLR